MSTRAWIWAAAAAMPAMVSRPLAANHDFPWPGFEDTSFAGGATPVGAYGDWGSDVAVDAAGRIVVVGTTFTTPSDADFAVLRYLPGGQLDPGFGSGGKVVTSFGATEDRAEGVAVQADGKIVAMGTAGPLFAVARYNDDGSPDSTFDGDGKAVTFVNENAYVWDGTLMADGRILVVGEAEGAVTGQDVVLVRYLADGTVDTGFGTGGIVAPTINGHQAAHAVTLTASGRIVVAGEAGISPTARDFFLARFYPDGQADETFGSFGLVVTSFGPGSDGARALALQPDGKLVVAGRTYNGSNFDYALARYHSSGVLDTTFGNQGKVVSIQTTTGDEAAAAVAVQSHGRIVMAGRGHNPAGGFDFGGLVRFDRDGTRDTGFGTGGSAIYAHLGQGAGFEGMALQPDGKIVVTGEAMAATSDVLVMRYLGHLKDHIFEDGFEGPA